MNGAQESNDIDLEACPELEKREEKYAELNWFWKFSVYVPIIGVLTSIGTLLIVAKMMGDYQNISFWKVIWTKYISYNLGASYYTGLVGNTISCIFTIATYVLVFIYNRESKLAIYGKWWGRILVGVGMIPAICLFLLSIYNFDMMKVNKVYDPAKGYAVRTYGMTPDQKRIWWWHNTFMTGCSGFCAYECFTAFGFFVKIHRRKSRQTRANWITLVFMVSCVTIFFVMCVLESFKYRTRIFQWIMIFCIWIYNLSFSYIFYSLLYAEGSTLFRKKTELK